MFVKSHNDDPMVQDDNDDVDYDWPPQPTNQKISMQDWHLWRYWKKDRERKNRELPFGTRFFNR